MDELEGEVMRQMYALCGHWSEFDNGINFVSNSYKHSQKGKSKDNNSNFRGFKLNSE